MKPRDIKEIKEKLPNDLHHKNVYVNEVHKIDFLMETVINDRYQVNII